MTPSSVNQAIQINKTGLRNASATNSMGGKELGKQDFLNLLMTQMANQDPLDPMKSENMMQQLAAMGTVEQLQNLNNQTAQLMALQQDISRATSANLLGKDVEIGSQSLGITEGKILPQLTDSVEMPTGCRLWFMTLKVRSYANTTLKILHRDHTHLFGTDVMTMVT